MKFKVGDKVRVRLGSRYENQRIFYDIQTIVRRSPMNSYTWLTDKDANYTEDDLELVGKRTIQPYGIVRFMIATGRR